MILYLPAGVECFWRNSALWRKYFLALVVRFYGCIVRYYGFSFPSLWGEKIVTIVFCDEQRFMMAWYGEYPSVIFV